jgi:hypothetical protein
MMRGTCVHKAVAHDYAQKVESKVNLPIEDVLDKFSDEYETRSGEVAWKDGEDKGKIKDGGYYAARGNTYCSPDGCGFWKLCVEEFGG